MLVSRFCLDAELQSPLSFIFALFSESPFPLLTKSGKVQNSASSLIAPFLDLPVVFQHCDEKKVWHKFAAAKIDAKLKIRDFRQT